MARIRTIKPDFWADEKIGNLTMLERLLFIGSWNIADDEGLLQISPAFIKSVLFPYDTISTDDISKAIDRLESDGFYHIYSHRGVKYAWIIMFRVHQRIDKPQRPTAPCPSIQNQEFQKAVHRRDKWTCHLCGEECAEFSLIGQPENPNLASLDHIVPRSEGGGNYPSNLRTACISCNKSRCDGELPIIPEDSENIPRTFNAGKEGSGREWERNGRDEYKLDSQIPFQEIIDDLNQKANPGRPYKASSKITKGMIRARWREGARLEDFKHVHTVKCDDWLTDPKMRQYLNPDTLYRPSKFEKYLNQPIREKEQEWTPPNE